MKNNILISGGDERTLAIAEYFLKKSYTVKIDYFESEEAKLFNARTVKDKNFIADYIVLPLPITTDGINLNTPFYKEKIPLSDYINKITGKITVFGGMINGYVKNLFNERKLKYYDYFDNEVLQIRNSVPTAEGAIALMSDRLPITVKDSETVITGYGRIGKALSVRLHLLGSNVTVCARNEAELASAEMMGFKIKKLNDFILAPFNCDVIFNTVPFGIFDEKFLTELNENTVIIDLASKPYGCDAEIICDFGDKYIIASSLPGKTSPKTAGEIIAAAVYDIIKE